MKTQVLNLTMARDHLTVEHDEHNDLISSA